MVYLSRKVALNFDEIVDRLASQLVKNRLAVVYFATTETAIAENIEYAKELLEQEGFYTDKDGQLYDKDGNAVEFDLYTNAGQTEREACGVMVKEDLKALGIKINFKPIEFNSLVSKMMTTSDWDMVLMGLTGSPLEPHSGKNVWYSKGHLHLFNMRFDGDKEDTILPWEKELD